MEESDEDNARWDYDQNTEILRREHQGDDGNVKFGEFKRSPAICQRPDARPNGRVKARESVQVPYLFTTHRGPL